MTSNFTLKLPNHVNLYEIQKKIEKLKPLIHLQKIILVSSKYFIQLLTKQ